MKVGDYGSSLVLRTFCFKVDKCVNIKDIIEFFQFYESSATKLNIFICISSLRRRASSLAL